MDCVATQGHDTAQAGALGAGALGVGALGVQAGAQGRWARK